MILETITPLSVSKIISHRPRNAYILAQIVKCWLNKYNITRILSFIWPSFLVTSLIKGLM